MVLRNQLGCHVDIIPIENSVKLICCNDYYDSVSLSYFGLLWYIALELR